MYRHILVPTDGSKLSETAIRHGIALAKSVHATITGLTVFEPFHTISVEPLMVTDTPDQYRADCAAEADKRLAVVKDAAALAGVPCEVLYVTHDDPYQAIIDTAADRDCDLIVMASHGRRGVAALVLGSETMKVLTHSRIPVLVCR